jgi:hypothetical protein
MGRGIQTETNTEWRSHKPTYFHLERKTCLKTPTAQRSRVNQQYFCSNRIQEAETFVASGSKNGYRILFSNAASWPFPRAWVFEWEWYPKM